MRLNNKMLLAFGIIWAVFWVLNYIIAQQYLMKGFLNIENKQIETNISRVNKALDQVLYSLGTFCTDWAHWNDAYDYIEGSNPQFVPNNLDIASFITSNINLLMYLNKQGEILIGMAVNLNEKKQVAFPQGLDKYIYPGSIFEKNVDFRLNNRGYLLLPSGIMLIASAGTSYTDVSKPINGTLIVGRFLSQQLLQKLADDTSLTLGLYLTDDINAHKEIKNVYEKTIENNQNENIIIKNNNIAYGYTVLHDIYNQPIGMLRITQSRDIYQTGIKTIRFYLGIYVVSGIILGIIVWLLIRFLILKRIEFLNKKIKEIGSQKNYKKRIEMRENDELASVATEFNHLMDITDASHEKLKKQVEKISLSEQKLESINAKLMTEIDERKQMQQKINILNKELILAARRAGMADIASGILHNVGNILNNVTTSIGVIKEVIEKNQAQNIIELAILLEKHKDNLVDFLLKDPRGSKIIEYLDLLAKALNADYSQLGEEIHNLDQYVGHVKDVITMQQSVSSVIGMVEKISLSEVIENALTLNRAVYENKEININIEYQFADEVILDRVKLLHVLVNLIKNAIESLLSSSNMPKEIFIKVFKKNDMFFTIEVQDNGEGVLPDNVTKIFTYGFTTKKNGNGIGLHTSATFIQEMGGKLYVRSAGQGLGATFVIELPKENQKDKKT